MNSFSTAFNNSKLLNKRRKQIEIRKVFVLFVQITKINGLFLFLSVISVVCTRTHTIAICRNMN